MQELLLRQAKDSLQLIAECSSGLDALIFIGLPFVHEQKLYNVAAAIHNGKILAFIP